MYSPKPEDTRSWRDSRKNGDEKYNAVGEAIKKLRQAGLVGKEIQMKILAARAARILGVSESVMVGYIEKLTPKQRKEIGLAPKVVKKSSRISSSAG